MKSRLFIVHGYLAHPHSHWFAWLTQQFTEIESHIIALPNSDQPDLDAWLQTLQHEIGHVDENTYIVAHSLGCTTTLRFLNGQTPNTRLGGLLLVAGFIEALPNLPQLDAFNRLDLSQSHLQTQILSGAVLLSEDDEDVSPAATRRLADFLNLPLQALQGRGHFTLQDGCDTLPEAAQWLTERLNANASVSIKSDDKSLF